MGMIADFFVKLTLKKEGFDRGLDQSKNKVSNFSNGIKKIGGMIAGAFAIGSITSFLGQAQKLAGETENVRKAFVRLGGGSYFKDLNEATRGTLSQVDLMKNTIQATNFGIPIKDLANLFKFATEKAAQTGQSVEYLTQSIVMGIGRKSVLILDNLGISAVQLREKLKKVGEEAATVGDVAEAIGSIAEEQFKRMGEQASTTAQKLDDVKGSWNDIKIAIGDAINQNDLFIGGIKILSDHMNVFSAQAQNAMTNAGSRVKRFMDISVTPKGNIEEQKAAIKKEIELINQTILDEQKKLSGFSWLTIGGKRKKDDTKQEIATLKNQAIELTGIFDTLKVKVDPIPLTQRISDLELLISMEKKLASQKGITAEEAINHSKAIKKAEEELKELREIAGIKEVEFLRGSIGLMEEEIKLIEEKIKKITDPQILAQLQSELRIKKDIVDQETKSMKLMELKTMKNKDVADLFTKGIKTNPKDKFDTTKLVVNKKMTDDIIDSKASADSYDAGSNQVQGFVDGMNDTLERGIEDAVITMADGIGKLMSGEMGWQDFGNSILQTVGAFMVQFGSLLIAYGIASDAFKKAFSNPFIAIAAGVALVAIGSAISSMGSKGVSSSSSGGGGGYSGASGYTPQSSSGIAVNVGGSFELHGTVLKAAIHNTERKNNLIR